MRTLKKTLCLVLALVLCFGLVGTAFAGNFDDYTDAETVGTKYEEAVDVLMGLGVVNGMTETEIGPEGTFTRAQAAKIIAYLELGPDVAAQLPAGKSGFADVAADHWASAFIAYCAKEGIINGYDAVNFGPEDELTGYQWAAMLLRAVGYGKNGEYTGTGWAIAVAKDAFKANVALFTGDAAAATDKVIQRQQAMLMAFNALEVDHVVYDKDTESYVNDGSAVDFATDVFGLTKVTTTIDGVEGRVWKVKDETVAVSEYYTDAVPVATITNGTEISALYTTTSPAYNKAVANGLDASVTYYVNGTKVIATAEGAAGELYVHTDDKLMVSVAAAADDVEYAKAGAEVVVYADPVAKKITNVVITEKAVATVATNGVTVTPVLNQDSNVSIALVGGGEISGTTKTVVGYEGLVKDDVILYYTYGDVKYVEKATSFVAQMTGTKIVAGVTNYTIGGNAYTVSGLTGAAVPDSNAADYNKDTTYYLDNYGYIVKAVAVTPAPVAKNYGVVLNYAWNPANVMNGTAASSRVQMATMDGKVAIYDTATNNGQPANLSISDVGLYEYVMNDNGVITKLTAVTAPTADTVDGPYTEKSNSIALDDGSGDNDDTLYLNSNTQVIFYGGSALNQYNAISKPVAVVTGYTNIPGIANDTAVNYVTNAVNTNVIDVLFVNATCGSLTQLPALAYIVDTTPVVSVEKIDGVDTEVYTYTVYVDGVETTMKTTSNSPVTAGMNTYVTTNGYTTFNDVNSTYNTNAGAGETLTYVEGTYIVAGSSNYKVDANTAYYLVDGTAKTVTADAIELIEGKTVTVTHVVLGIGGAGTPVAAIYYTVA